MSIIGGVLMTWGGLLKDAAAKRLHRERPCDRAAGLRPMAEELLLANSARIRLSEELSRQSERHVVVMSEQAGQMQGYINRCSELERELSATTQQKQRAESLTVVQSSDLDKLERRVIELQNELRLSKLSAEAAGAKMLELQQVCISTQAEKRELESQLRAARLDLQAARQVIGTQEPRRQP